MDLEFVKMSQNAVAPWSATPFAAGYDLCSAYDYHIGSKGKMVCLTDLQIAIPDGCYGRIAPRSGLAVNNFIDVLAGVVDSDYRGNVGIVLANFGEETFNVKRGDRIAQLICERIEKPNIKEQNVLSSSGTRGSAGFGSSGMNVKESAKKVEDSPSLILNDKDPIQYVLEMFLNFCKDIRDFGDRLNTTKKIELIDSIFVFWNDFSVKYHAANDKANGKRSCQDVEDEDAANDKANGKGQVYSRKRDSRASFEMVDCIDEAEDNDDSRGSFKIFHKADIFNKKNIIN